MKIKTDFVTNSSSTSHIIAIKDYDPKTDEIVVRCKINEMDHQVLKIEDDIENYLYDIYGYNNMPIEEMCDNDTDCNEKHIQMMKALQTGKQIIVLDVSSEDENPISMALYESGLKKEHVAENKKDFVIIKGYI